LAPVLAATVLTVAVGAEVIAGRISGEVANVTVTQGGKTATATLATTGGK
jgi:hypothetical protein